MLTIFGVMNVVGGVMTREEMEQNSLEHPGLMEELCDVDFPRGFTLRDFHAVFDEEYNSKLSKEEFINGMFRIIFNSDFQRNCCVLLQIANIRQQMADNFVLCMFMRLNLYLALHPRLSILVRTTQVTSDAMFYFLTIYSSEVSVLRCMERARNLTLSTV